MHTTFSIETAPKSGSRQASDHGPDKVRKESASLRPGGTDGDSGHRQDEMLHRVEPTRHLLSDGRELLLFYSRDDRPREAVRDPRAMPTRPAPGELRFDPLLEEWVTIASHRQDRTHLPVESDCPLCPSQGGRKTEIPVENYEVAVFENRFPSYQGEPGEAEINSAIGESRRPAAGRCEVVCFTAEHDAVFANLERDRVRLIMDVWAQRSETLARLNGVEYVFCFQNHGKDIGVTMHHPHGQIYAYPFVPPVMKQISASAFRYQDRTGRNLFEEILAQETRGKRVVTGNDHWVAFVPATARWPYEVHLYPLRRVPDLLSLTHQERNAFTEVYLDLLLRFRRLFTPEDAPYVSAWYQAPVKRDRELMYLHLRLFTTRRDKNKLKYLAASESVMGAFSNDITPEDAAERLRAVL